MRLGQMSPYRMGVIARTSSNHLQADQQVRGANRPGTGRGLGARR